MTKVKSKKIKIIPLGPWVLVRPNKVDEKSGSIYLPEQAEKEKKHIGEVCAAGPDVKNNSIKKGVFVMFGAYAGEDVQEQYEHEQKKQVDYKLVLEEDILAIVEWI